MSKCSKKCNEIKQKLDSISGLDDDFVFETLCKIENQIDLLNKYADIDELNGTCFKQARKENKNVCRLDGKSSFRREN